MPDICMCSNECCPMRFKCFRYIAKPSPYQSFSRFEPKEYKCDHFWPVNDEPVQSLADRENDTHG